MSVQELPGYWQSLTLCGGGAIVGDTDDVDRPPLAPTNGEAVAAVRAVQHHGARTFREVCKWVAEARPQKGQMDVGRGTWDVKQGQAT